MMNNSFALLAEALEMKYKFNVATGKELTSKSIKRFKRYSKKQFPEIRSLVDRFEEICKEMNVEYAKA